MNNKIHEKAHTIIQKDTKNISYATVSQIVDTVVKCIQWRDAIKDKWLTTIY